MAKHHVSCTINGDAVDFLCEPTQTLLDVLRDELELTGTKEGCATGDCGACTVAVDGTIVCSCLVLGAEVGGKTIDTIEGMAERREPASAAAQVHRARRAAMRHLHAGPADRGRNLLERNTNPSEEEVRYWLAGNLCRCTGYNNVVNAVMDAAKEMRGA